MPDETPVQVPAIGFSVETKFNQTRTVVTQFHVGLGTEPKEIYQALTKVLDVVDRAHERDLIKGLKITLDRDTAQLETDRIRVANLEDAYRNEHVANGRKGEFKLHGQQKTNVDNQRSGLAALEDRIRKVRSEIAELESLQKAYA